jgi:hypothetical protein
MASRIHRQIEINAHLYYMIIYIASTGGQGLSQARARSIIHDGQVFHLMALNYTISLQESMKICENFP